MCGPWASWNGARACMRSLLDGTKAPTFIVRAWCSCIPRISGAKGGHATNAFFRGLLCGVFACAMTMPYHGIARHAELPLPGCSWERRESNRQERSAHVWSTFRRNPGAFCRHRPRPILPSEKPEIATHWPLQIYLPVNAVTSQTQLRAHGRLSLRK